jgi:hypothetical protein
MGELRSFPVRWQEDMSAAEFVHGLDLGGAFYEEAGKAIIESVVAPEAYAAGLLGRGSDVLGFDTETSTDHNWGPRFQVFLDEKGFEKNAPALDAALRERLPHMFRGHPTNFPDPDPLESDDQTETTPANGPVHHLIEITTIGRFSTQYLGMDARGPIDVMDWLVFPEQRLLELTAGEVFHDPHSEIRHFRERLASYPRDVWLYRMACQWQRLAQEETFAGRSAEVGDALGMRIATARTVRDIMRLCFLMERRYCPYGKWIGSAFARLACAARLQPSLQAALAAGGIAEIEEHLAAVYTAIAEMHNGLGVTGPLETAPREFLGRPYLVIRAARFANALLAAIESEELRKITVRMGGIDQFIDCTDYIENPKTYQGTKSVYR